MRPNPNQSTQTHLCSFVFLLAAMVFPVQATNRGAGVVMFCLMLLVLAVIVAMSGERGKR